MPRASKAFQALVHSVKANPVFLKLSQDSKTKLRTPNLHANIYNQNFSLITIITKLSYILLNYMRESPISICTYVPV
jgi:hypothetical protein